MTICGEVSAVNFTLLAKRMLVNLGSLAVAKQPHAQGTKVCVGEI